MIHGFCYNKGADPEIFVRGLSRYFHPFSQLNTSFFGKIDDKANLKKYVTWQYSVAIKLYWSKYWHDLKYLFDAVNSLELKYYIYTEMSACHSPFATITG